MSNNNVEINVTSTKEIALATRAAMDQMLMYFAQAYTSEKFKSDDLIKAYLLAIINTMSLYLEKMSYEDRMIIESEIKKIISNTIYSEEEIELAKMPVMGNA
jgi:hypothetical protein